MRRKHHSKPRQQSVAQPANKYYLGHLEEIRKVKDGLGSDCKLTNFLKTLKNVDHNDNTYLKKLYDKN